MLRSETQHDTADSNHPEKCLLKLPLSLFLCMLRSETQHDTAAFFSLALLIILAQAFKADFVLCLGRHEDGINKKSGRKKRPEYKNFSLLIGLLH